MTSWLAIATAAVAIGTAAAQPAASPAAESAVAAQAIPVELRVPFAPIPVRSEGQWHLVYEIHVTNYGSKPLRLHGLDVLAPGSAAPLASWSSESVGTIIAHPGSGAVADKQALPGGGLAVLFVDVTMAEQQPLPRALTQRVRFAPVETISGGTETFVDGGRTEVRAQPTAVGPPLAGGCWIASHGLSNDSVHRRTVLALNGAARISQRFAIDWIRVGKDGQAFRGDPSDNRNWTPYGADVLAVADARVVDVRDGIPENDPTEDKKAVPITVATVGGNALILDLGDGRYAFYAHLQPGSIRVHPGERVRRGQVLGKLGNSGQSDAPHLHIQLMDAPSALVSEGLPLAFEGYRLQGHVPSLKILTDGTGWRPGGPASAHRNEMPLENSVIAFPGGSTPCAEAP
jgi:hypothetical protein